MNGESADPEADHAPTVPDWRRLITLADDEVRRTLRALPPELRQTAQSLPVSFEPCPSPALVEDGLDPDTLGLFVGGDHESEEHAVLPPRIILYLENIWLMIADEGGDETDFRREVRTTLLHELGHYLGLDEEELTDRGLE